MAPAGGGTRIDQSPPVRGTLGSYHGTHWNRSLRQPAPLRAGIPRGSLQPRRGRRTHRARASVKTCRPVRRDTGYRRRIHWLQGWTGSGLKAWVPQEPRTRGEVYRHQTHALRARRRGPGRDDKHGAPTPRAVQGSHEDIRARAVADNASPQQPVGATKLASRRATRHPGQGINHLEAAPSTWPQRPGDRTWVGVRVARAATPEPSSNGRPSPTRRRSRSGTGLYLCMYVRYAPC